MSEQVTRTKIEQSVLAELGKVYRRIGDGKSRQDDQAMHDILIDADVASRSNKSMDPLIKVLGKMVDSSSYDISSFGKRMWAILMEDATDPLPGTSGRSPVSH